MRTIERLTEGELRELREHAVVRQLGQAQWWQKTTDTGKTRAWLGVLSGVASVLSGRRIKVESVDADTAYTDGEEIYIGKSHITKEAGLTDEDVAVVKGFVYHELGHVIDSPRHDEDWHRVHIEAISRATSEHVSRVHRLWNVLEDQRIEVRMALRWPSLVPWLQAPIYRILVAPQAQRRGSAEAVWPLLHGRVFLPAAVRDAARAVYVARHDEEVVNEIAEIIDAWIECDYATDTDEMVDLLHRLVVLLPDPSEVLAQDLITVAAQLEGERGLPGGGPPITVDDLESLREASDRQSGAPGEQSQADPAEGDAESGGWTSNTDEAGGTRDETAPLATGQDDDGDQGTGSSSAEAAEGDGDGQSDTGTKFPAEVARPGTLEALQSAVDEQRERLYGSDLVRGEIRRTRRAVAERLDRLALTDLPPAPIGAVATPPDIDVAQVWAVADAIAEIREGASPQPLHHQRRGRVNVRDYGTRRGNWDVRVFDASTEDALERTSVEVVLAVDTSGSMSGEKIERASRAAWVLKRAFDEAEGVECSLLLWDTNAAIGWSADDPASPSELPIWITGGGTSPADATTWASRKLVGSDAAIKQYWLITDGQFSLAPVEDSLNVLADAGVANYLVEIPVKAGRLPQSELRDERAGRLFDRRIVLTNVRQLATMVAESVEDAMTAAVWS